jgi:hypothetical protein
VTECQSILHTMTKHVMSVLECSRAEWMLNGGTLLGIVREQSLSPNPVDMDADLVLTERWFNHVAAKEGSAQVRALNALGYHIFSDHPVLRVCIGHQHPGLVPDTEDMNGSYVDNYKYVDLYSLLTHATESGPPMHTIDGYPDVVYPHDDLFPTYVIEFQKCTLRMPARPESVLRTLYDDWTEVQYRKHGQ